MRVRKYALLLVLVAVSLLLLTLQSRGYGSRAGDLVAAVTTPLQAGYARVTRGALAVWTTYRDWKNVRAENRRLRAEIERLRVEALRVSETDDENRRLRTLLARPGRPPPAAPTSCGRGRRASWRASPGARSGSSTWRATAPPSRSATCSSPRGRAG